jgi:hypothetical protein
MMLPSRGEEPDGTLSTSKASPPGRSIRSAQVRPLPPGRVEEKRRSFPSGDQRGLLLSTPGEVSRIGSPPAAGTSHTSACRLLSAATSVVTVKAICFPSGETAGLLTVVTLYQSFGVKARACAASGEVSAVRAVIPRASTVARAVRRNSDLVIT